MAVDPCKWLHIVKDAPRSILDIDMAAVDTDIEGAWVRIRRRVLAPNASTAYHELLAAYKWHPSQRMGVSTDKSKVNTVHIRDQKYFPAWLKARIAVLNVAPIDAMIPKVGMRWRDVHTPMSEHRWYTIELGCEELHDAA